MSRRHPKRANGAKHWVQLEHYLLKSDAWRDLDSGPRALFIELLFRFNGHNNGTIALGVRDAGSALNVGKTTATRWFSELEEHGFIQVAVPSSFGQKRLAKEWLLTTHIDDRNGNPATKKFMKWRPEKQKLGPSQVHIGPSQVHEKTQVNSKSTHRPVSGTVIAQK